jgi:hypothetical protein
MIGEREASLARRLCIFLGAVAPPAYIMNIHQRSLFRDLFEEDPDRKSGRYRSFCVYHRPRRFFDGPTGLLARIDTFARRRIEKRIRKSEAKKGLPLLLYQYKYRNEGQHGSCRHIPVKYRDREIVSVSRSPFDHYISWYEVRSKRFDLMTPSDPRHRRAKGFPGAEKPSFEEFVKCVNQQVTRYNPSVSSGVGPLSIMFIRYYARDPGHVLRVLSRDYVRSGRWKSDSFPVTFLPQENLAPALRDFLARKGIEEKYLPTVERETEKEWHVTRKGKSRDWRTYYSPELAQYVREREWFLFEIFPEYEIASGAAGT